MRIMKTAWMMRTRMVMMPMTFVLVFVLVCMCVGAGEGLHGGQGCVRGFTIMLHQLLSGCVPAWANALSAHPCHHTMAINTQAH